MKNLERPIKMSFKLKFAKMYDNEIFQQYGIKPVVEDFFVAEEGKFCVADGVTRDSIFGEAIPYPKNREEVENWIAVYPNPSGAYLAAKICADTFIDKLVQYSKEEVKEELIFQIVQEINQKIADINKGRKIDYLANDYYGCVAVGGYIIEDIMYCFSIGDCHIMTLDANFEVQFSTINNHLPFEEYLENVYCKKNHYDWNNPADRIMVRKEYRNKPEKQYQGKEISFGVLTGEKEAEHYVDVYQVDLKDIKYICAYSDGCEEFLSNKEDIKKYVENPNLIANQGEERTLIIYER